jgi:hypothetical protein
VVPVGPAEADLESSGIMPAVVAALAIWVVDLCTANVNLSILYPLTVFLYARSGRRIATWWYTLGIAALAFSGYLLGRWPTTMHTWGEMLTNFRLVNRLLGVAATAAVAWTIKVSLRLEAQMRLRRRETLEADADQPVYDEIVRAFEQFSAVVLSAVLTIAITTADLISPMEINLPILYAIPLVACLWARKTTMVWVLLPILLLCSLMGYRWGPASTGLDSAIPYILRNRLIATVVISMIGLGVHVWIRTHANGRSVLAAPARGRAMISG